VRQSQVLKNDQRSESEERRLNQLELKRQDMALKERDYNKTKKQIFDYVYSQRPLLLEQRKDDIIFV
jgi:hypothetical protein